MTIVPETKPTNTGDERAEELPSFMKGDTGMGKEAIGPGDVFWDLEGNGPVSVGYDTRTPLELLVTAIVNAYPHGQDRDDTDSRVSAAMCALVGRAPARGRPRSNDENLLLSIAWHYHCALVEGQEVDLSALIRRTLLDEGYSEDLVSRSEDGDNRHVRRLRSAFESQKEALLMRATHENDWERMRAFTMLHELFEILARWNSYVGDGARAKLPLNHKIEFDQAAIRPHMQTRTNKSI